MDRVVGNCPDCGADWSGCWIQRDREVIELSVVLVQVTEQVCIAWACLGLLGAPTVLYTSAGNGNGGPRR